jgi:hypothetical protein
MLKKLRCNLFSWKILLIAKYLTNSEKTNILIKTNENVIFQFMKK